MTFNISISGTDISIAAEKDETLLSAIQRAGYDVPYSCNKGVCGNCKGHIVSGSCDQENATAGISKEDLERGDVLFCIAHPKSDLVIEPIRINKRDALAPKEYKLKIYKKTQAADDVTVMHLRMPIGQRAKFKAGQYIEIGLPDGDQRNYSIASIPGSDTIELHIRHIPNGKFTSEILPNLKVGDYLLATLPKGDFYIREASQKQIIFIASGTGLAPIQSILSYLAKKNELNAEKLYWGVRSKKDLYAIEKIREILSPYPNFEFIPVLSEALPEDHWNGREGLVHQAVLEDIQDMKNCEVYACGSPLMIQAASKSFISSRDLPASSFYSDSFA